MLFYQRKLKAAHFWKQDKSRQDVQCHRQSNVEKGHLPSSQNDDSCSVFFYIYIEILFRQKWASSICCIEHFSSLITMNRLMALAFYLLGRHHFIVLNIRSFFGIALLLSEVYNFFYFVIVNFPVLCQYIYIKFILFTASNFWELILTLSRLFGLLQHVESPVESRCRSIWIRHRFKSR